jgi:hypothetical protein
VQPVQGDDTATPMSTGAAIAIGATIGLALGVLVGVVTDLPLAPEAGLVLGALAGWFWGRGSGEARAGR